MSFLPISQDDSVVDYSIVVGPLWTGNVSTLTSGSFYTSSAQEISTNGLFYLSSYNLPYGTSGSEVQFSVAYGHVSGSGSAPFNSLVPYATPSRDIYGQYRSLIFGDENSVFNFGIVSGSSQDIAVININRSRYKESLNVGSLNLVLASGSNSITLTDNSNDVTVTSFVGPSRVYTLVSGSNGRSYNSSSVQTVSGSYGQFFPDYGLIVLNPRALALTSSAGGIGMQFNLISSSGYTLGYNQNNSAIFSAIQQGASFRLSSQETISTEYLFIRVKNKDFNYTTNPSIIDNNGNLLFNTLVNNPQVYVTTLGLYNDLNELIAVAKLSKPLPKDFTKELLLRVKIDF